MFEGIAAVEKTTTNSRMHESTKQSLLHEYTCPINIMVNCCMIP